MWKNKLRKYVKEQIDEIAEDLGKKSSYMDMALRLGETGFVKEMLEAEVRRAEGFLYTEKMKENLPELNEMENAYYSSMIPVLQNDIRRKESEVGDLIQRFIECDVPVKIYTEPSWEDIIKYTDRFHDLTNELKKETVRKIAEKAQEE